MKLKNKNVSEISTLIVREASVIGHNSCVAEALNELVKDTRTRHLYVVDEQNKVVGSIRLNDLVGFLFTYISWLSNDALNKFVESFDRQSVIEIMLKEFLFVRNDTSITDMVRIMLENKVNELPIVDNEGHILGEVNLLELIKYMVDFKGASRN